MIAILHGYWKNYQILKYRDLGQNNWDLAMMHTENQAYLIGLILDSKLYKDIIVRLYNLIIAVQAIKSKLN